MKENEIIFEGNEDIIIDRSLFLLKNTKIVVRDNKRVTFRDNIHQENNEKAPPPGDEEA